MILTFLMILVACSSQPSVPDLKESDNTLSALVLGAERLNQYLPFIQDKRVALAVNHTSLLGGQHLVDTLLSLGVNIKKVFAPEHGFRGAQEAGELVESGIDPKTRLPIVSLYGSNKKPTQSSSMTLILYYLISRMLGQGSLLISAPCIT